MIGLLFVLFGGSFAYGYEQQTGKISHWLSGYFPPQPQPRISPSKPNSAPPPAYTKLDFDVLSRTLWGEARGQGYSGMQAVANVIMNRVKSRGFPNSAAAVCQQKWQFSVWNANDPNLGQMMNVTTADANFRIAQDIADKALRGVLPDITGGADHYLNVAATLAMRRGSLPDWVDMKLATREIGEHTFLRLG